MEEIDFSDDKLKITSSLSIKEIRSYHSKLLSEDYANCDSVIRHLVPFYLPLSLKSPLKKPIRLLLTDADSHTTLLPYLSDVVVAKVTCLSDDLFTVVEECMTHLPGGQKCIEDNLHLILIGMNKLFLNNVALPLNLFPMIKSYHKIIVTCQSCFQQCLNNHVSVTSEYGFIKDNLIRFSKGCELRDENENFTNLLFGGVVRLMWSENDDISQTALFVIITLMRCLAARTDELVQDLELIFKNIISTKHTPNVKVIFGIVSASPSEFVFLTSENNNIAIPIYATIINTIYTFLATEECVKTRHLWCRCLHSCITTLSKYATIPRYGAMLLQSIEDPNGIRNTTVSIIMNNWDSYNEHIRHSIKYIFEEFLALLKLLFTSDCQIYFEDLAKSFLLLDDKLTTKYKYLSLLSNYIPLQRWIALDPLLPETLPTIMDECALATHVGEFWGRLVCQDSIQFSEIQPWIDSLLNAISQVSETHSQLIYDYCKKGLISCHSDSLRYIANHTPATGQGLLFLVQCHKQAQRQITNREIPCLSSEQLAFSLKTSSPELSLSVLELVCHSHQSTAIVSEEHFALILKGLTLIISTSSTSCRNKFIVAMKVLIDRIEKSAHRFFQQKLDLQSSPSLISHYSAFLSNISSLLFAYLNPMSSNGITEVVLALLPPMFRLYLLNTNLFPPDFSITDFDLEHLLSILKDTYESNCRMALDALLILKDRVSVWLGSESNYCILLDEMFNLMLSPISVHSTSASYYLKLLFTIDPYRLHASITDKYPQIADTFHTQENPVPIEIICLYDMMELLVSQLQASQDHWDPISNCFYSILRCIKKLLLIEDSITSCPLSILQECFGKLTLLCTQVLAITGPIVCSSSPEGVLHMSDIGDNVVDSQSPNSRAILLCSWQSLKEISLLYSEIVELIISKHPSLIDSDFLNRIYEFYLNYLIEARHRGAFELTYTGFLKLCKFVWVSSTSGAKCLPSIWLESVLNNLSNKDNEMTQLKLLSCATRRSAGLPYLVLAILANEPQHLNNKYLFLTMDTLTTLAANVLISPVDIIARVHCLNIMRALFKDNKLRNLMHQFVSATIKLVINCVESTHWPIRNASHLLFSSLISRVFGVKRMQDENAWQNKLTMNNFFTRYPNLLDMFLNKLKSSAEKSCEIQSDYSVFMILTILSRLYISKSDFNSATENAVIPLLFSLSENPSWKLREMCAHAICSLLYTHPFSDVFDKFQQFLNTSKHPTQNKTHGFLLILKEYYQTRYSQFSIEESRTSIIFCVNLIPNCLYCAANHCLLMQIISALLSHSSEHLFTLLATQIDIICSHLSVSCDAIGNSTQKPLGDKLLVQFNVSSYLDLTLTLLSKLDSSQQLLIDTLLAIVSQFLKHSDTINSCFQSLIIHPFHSFKCLPLLLKLFPDIIMYSNTSTRVNCLKAILHIRDYKLETIAHELSKLTLDLNEVLNNDIIHLSTECSLFDENIYSIIMFASCLLLAINYRQQQNVSANRLIHLIYQTAIDAQDPNTLSYITSATSALYKLVLSGIFKTALHEWYFLLLYIIQQDKSTEDLSSLIISTYQETTQDSHFKLPPSPHPNILTQLLLENVAIYYDDITSINVLLFMFEGYPLESDGETEDEVESERIFVETTFNNSIQPDMVLMYISKLMEKLIKASQKRETLLERVSLRYLEYDKQETCEETKKITWNRKEYMKKLKCDTLKYILNKWKYGSFEQKPASQFDDHSNENIHRYRTILSYDILFS